MQDEKLHPADFPDLTIYSFADDYIRPVLQVINNDDGSSKWFITNEDMKTFTEIDPEGLWFWTKKWQAKEREADEDIRSGRYEDFDNTDDLFKL